MAVLIDITGATFGRLLVLERAPNNGRRVRWRCVCTCGEHVYAQGENLRGGHTTSCGCRQREVTARRNVEQHPARKYADPMQSARNQVIIGYRTGARLRGLAWNLSSDECTVLFASECTYCGAPPSNTHVGRGGSGKNRTPFAYNGIDRVDNEHGYETDNVAAACMSCNRAKHTMTLSDFKNWVRALASRLGTSP